MTHAELIDSWLSWRQLPAPIDTGNDVMSKNKRYNYCYLSKLIVVVAIYTTMQYPNGKFSWCAKIGITPGRNCDVEWWDVRKNGDLLDEDVALSIFTDIPKDTMYRREE